MKTITHTQRIYPKEFIQNPGQCCENCIHWTRGKHIETTFNEYKSELIKTATPSPLGACIISTRTDKDGETCYLQTHRTSGTYCLYHIPLSPSFCTAIIPHVIHL